MLISAGLCLWPGVWAFFPNYGAVAVISFLVVGASNRVAMDFLMF